jgi:hypothetical protein
MRWSVVIHLAVSFGLACGEMRIDQLVKTTLCEVVKTPERFNGKLLEIRSDFVSKFQWSGLVDNNCAAKIQIGVYHVLDDLIPRDGEYAFTTTADDLTHPERLTWMPVPPLRPIRLTEDENYKTLRRYADTKFQWKDGGTCLDCPLYRIGATVVGRFDHFETQTMAVRINASTKPFIHSAGQSNASLSRFILNRVVDVSATSIDPSVYSEPRRRIISVQEANDLVYAYLKTMGCSERTCALEPSDPDPGFYGFQALHDNPGGSPNLGFFAVDQRTGDVWSAVVCEKFDSPALLTLQRTIRQRIGLTEEEYRKAKSRGPFCEPGKKPRRVQSK